MAKRCRGAGAAVALGARGCGAALVGSLLPSGSQQAGCSCGGGAGCTPAEVAAVVMKPLFLSSGGFPEPPFARGEWVHAVSALVEGSGKAAPGERRQRALMEGEGLPPPSPPTWADLSGSFSFVPLRPPQGSRAPADSAVWQKGSVIAVVTEQRSEDVSCWANLSSSACWDMCAKKILDILGVSFNRS